jgi:hypothetical protein
MLKPSATKTLAQATTEELIAQFKQRGGVIAKVETGVALGLKKKKFVRKPPQMVA